jgi:hypothetical protein
MALTLAAIFMISCTRGGSQMATKNQPNDDRVAKQGGHAEQGRPFHPQDPHPAGGPETSTPPQAVPLGMPMSDEEYKILKKEALGGRPRAKSAQEDPSGLLEDDND